MCPKITLFRIKYDVWQHTQQVSSIKYAKISESNTQTVIPTSQTPISLLVNYIVGIEGGVFIVPYLILISFNLGDREKIQ